MTEKTPAQLTPEQYELLAEAEHRYGADAMFVYPRPAQRDFVAMTLRDAMNICGEYMVDENPQLLWKTLDKWHTMAQVLHDKQPAEFSKARSAGLGVLALRSANRDA
jgi:hypothetical protein